MEFPPDLYPQQADVTREEILRQIFGDVGELHYGTTRPSAQSLTPCPATALIINLAPFIPSIAFVSTSTYLSISLYPFISA
jgi:hypothetical protein